jgi:hypothetical protein
VLKKDIAIAENHAMADVDTLFKKTPPKSEKKPTQI